MPTCPPATDLPIQAVHAQRRFRHSSNADTATDVNMHKLEVNQVSHVQNVSESHWFRGKAFKSLCLVLFGYFYEAPANLQGSCLGD